MIEVQFSKQWRGHDPGTVVELTAERALELITGGYCAATDGNEELPQSIAEIASTALKKVTRRKRPKAISDFREADSTQDDNPATP